VNPLTPQDHDPLEITWVAGGFLELVTALVHPVPLDVIVVLEQHLTAPSLVECRNLLPRLSPTRQHLFNHQDQHVNLVIGLALQPGHGYHDDRLIAELPSEKKIVRSLESGRRHQFLYSFIHVYTLYKCV